MIDILIIGNKKALGGVGCEIPIDEWIELNAIAK